MRRRRELLSRRVAWASLAPSLLGLLFVLGAAKPAQAEGPEAHAKEIDGEEGSALTVAPTESEKSSASELVKAFPALKIPGWGLALSLGPSISKGSAVSLNGLQLSLELSRRLASRAGIAASPTLGFAQLALDGISEGSEGASFRQLVLRLVGGASASLRVHRRAQLVGALGLGGELALMLIKIRTPRIESARIFSSLRAGAFTGVALLASLTRFQLRFAVELFYGPHAWRGALLVGLRFPVGSTLRTRKL